MSANVCPDARRPYGSVETEGFTLHIASTLPNTVPIGHFVLSVTRG